MRIIMVGGGTGGHIYPAVTIARAIQSEVPDCQVLFVGTAQGLEADIIPKEGFDFTTIDICGLERKISWKNVKTLGKIAGSIWQSWKIIRDFQPDLLIGTGGYTCGPVLLAGSLMGIPTLIQEQNVVPGITNKILAKFVNLVAVGYPEAATAFHDEKKVIVTGNPIRDDVISVSREEGLAAFGLDPAKLTLLVSGGSRGARSINRAMEFVCRQIIERNDVQILHVTGQSEYNDVVGKYKQQGIGDGTAGNIIVKPYLYNMPLALAVADLVVFRAGAVGLAEITARGIPSILIPYPYAAENHQEFNARALEKAGAAVLIRDFDLTGPVLHTTIMELVENRDRLARMAAASKKLGRPQAARDIVQAALSLVSTYGAKKTEHVS
ncbi:MAG: UDP-N-acetylglucosamine--N-acetylmuramyl-(pentapeptide) pyrophosphoryl-undecaprenol [Firmicutes bacterium]|nr:UDP-N-acetylglucosamine--N-acetylmuramyl-(pentapeptide) pyrophosphoryl-undecaprenol [Bacillota bacterium]